MKLFLDLDGVFADFERYFEDFYGYRHDSVSDEEMWKKIDSHDNFFGSLPFMDGALEFYSNMQKIFPARDIAFLTACPRTNYRKAAIQKIEWVHSKMDSKAHVLPVLGGKNKCLFMHQKGDILVDDFDKNLKPWTQRGGIAVHHKNFVDTQEQILKIFK